MHNRVNASLYELIANANDPQIYLSAVIREKQAHRANDPILLVKSGAGPFKGMWRLPGGKLRHGIAAHDSLALHLRAQFGGFPDVQHLIPGVGQYMVARETGSPLHVVELHFHASLGTRAQVKPKRKSDIVSACFCNQLDLLKMQNLKRNRFAPGLFQALEAILGWDVDESPQRLTPMNVKETARRLASLAVRAVEDIGQRRTMAAAKNAKKPRRRSV